VIVIIVLACVMIVIIVLACVMIVIIVLACVMIVFVVYACVRADSKREVDQFLNTCELSCQMQEFIGTYILMEEYFMRQMVIKVSN